MPLDDIMVNWFQNLEDPVDNIASNKPVDLFIQEEEEFAVEAFSMPEYSAYCGLITKAPAYEWLVSTVQKEVVLAETCDNIDGNLKKKIRTCFSFPTRISRKSSADSFQMTFEMQWDLLNFAREQLYSETLEDVLKTAITLSGCGTDAQAMSCLQYVNQTWPSNGKYVFSLIKDVICGGQNHGKQTRKSSSPKQPFFLTLTLLGRLPDQTFLSAWVHRSVLNVMVVGTADSIAEIGEQIAWLSASLRSSPFDSGVCVCRPFICDIRYHDSDPSLRQKLSCKIDFSMDKTDEHHYASGQCWHGLFLNPVVVGGYPIPRRCEENTGLEIPLNMMIRLAGARRVTFFNSKLVIKGYSTLLVPMECHDNTILWHIIYDKQGNHISYLSDIVSQSANVSYSDLETCRHILGWCSRINSFAGECNSKNDIYAPTYF